jgi:hypothetical protein
MKKVFMALTLALFCGSAMAQTIKCDNVNNTLVYNHTWGDSAQKYSRSIGNFSDNDALVIKVDVPSTVALSAKKRYSFAGGEWQDGGVPRYIKASTKPCDFAAETSGTSFSADFYINNTPVVLKSHGLRLPQPTFKPGETFYINLKNPPNGCYGACNVFWRFN